METPYSGMVEVREASSLEETNKLLTQGFILVKVMERMVYVVGLPKEARELNANGNGKAAPDGRTTASSSAVLNSLIWKKFKNGGGEWTFFLGPDEALLPELESAREFIDRLRSEKEVVLDGWRYRISKERFLNRFESHKTEAK